MCCVVFEVNTNPYCVCSVYVWYDIGIHLHKSLISLEGTQDHLKLCHLRLSNKFSCFSVLTTIATLIFQLIEENLFENMSFLTVHICFFVDFVHKFYDLPVSIGSTHCFCLI